MDLNFYKDSIKQTMQVINSDSDSILKEAETMVKDYLETNTSISDNERAGIYAKFVTDTTTTAITQAIVAATQLTLEGAVNDQKILNMQGELAIEQAKGDSDIAVNTQKIASMQNEDTARRNEVAAKVAKAKIEIEQLIPSQISLNEKEIEVKSKELLFKDKMIEVETAKVDLMTQDVALKEKQVLLEEAKIPLITAQKDIEVKKLDVMTQDIALKEKQVEIESKKVDLMGAQISNELEKINLLIKQTGVEAEKIPLMQAQTQSEIKKTDLLSAQTEIEKDKLKLNKAEIQLRYADVYYRQQQARTVAMSLVVNERIENNKNETQIRIATIQAESI